MQAADVVTNEDEISSLRLWLISAFAGLVDVVKVILKFTNYQPETQMLNLSTRTHLGSDDIFPIQILHLRVNLTSLIITFSPSLNN